jgi:virginiamycin B lyase
MTRLLPFVTCAVALALPATASAGIAEFAANLTQGSDPVDITRGPDGALWFTQQGGNGGIGRITTAGAITEYPAGTTSGFSTGQMPSQITAGPDGALWFTEEGATGQIARLDPKTETVTEFATGLTPNRQPAGIAQGPDGNLWFTERGGAGAIGRITPTGMITEFTTGLTADSAPTDIAAGADGNLWFTEQANPGRVGRIDPDDGTITEFSVGLSPDSAPNHITAASNDKLYFTQAADPGRIGRIKVDGSVAQYTDGLTPNGRPGDIAQGGDGALWFTLGAAPGRLGRLWPDSSTITEFSGGVALDLTADSSPGGITRGPDGNVWFTERAFPGRIGRVTVPPLAQILVPSREVGGEPGQVALRAKIAANSQATTYYFEWGPDVSYGAKTAPTSAGSGADPVTEETDVELALDAHYHARVVAENASGRSVSPDKQFYLTAEGEIVKEKPVDKGNEGSSTVETPAAAPTSTPADHDDGGDDDAAAAPVDPPALGQAVVVYPESGSVLVKPPGQSHFAPLAAGARIAVGSLVDARRGRVVLQSALDTNGRTQTGTFWGAIFQVRQHRHGHGVTDLVLRGGSFARCGTRAGVSVLARDSGGRRRAIRRLWGKDRHARFRTHGRDSVATVRGTQWVTTDRCDGTLTKVRHGAVMVRDLRRKRSVLLRAGHAYLARHRRH